MPGKNSKQSTKTVTETPVEPAAVAPVVAAAPVVEAAEKSVAATTQKGGKKSVAKPAVPAVEAAAPASKAAEKLAVEAAAEKPAGAPAQKGGKKAAAKTATPVLEASPVAKKGGKKATAKEASDKPVTATQKGGKKAVAKPAAPKKVVKQTAEKQAGGDEEADEDSSDRRIRSFKVKLPNREDFEGRFTGLTPYQAANKALSKYFRETEKPLVEITFSICESTRKSRKSVYTYVGKRQKLETPVVYKIQDGREIVKSFKNSLKKVKKSDSSASA